MKISRLQLTPQITRIVVLGDPHGDMDGVKAVIAKENDDNTLVTCVGDVVGYSDARDGSELCEYFEKLGIPTVEGNHEDWLDSDGNIMIAPKGAETKLSRRTREWIKDLPHEIEIIDHENNHVATIAHSIRRPSWDWVNTTNISRYAASLNNPPVMITGHSHRPKFMDYSGTQATELFNYLEEEELSSPFHGSLLVDAGSIGRPEYIGRTKNHSVRYGSRGKYGTYAVIDFATQMAYLRRIVKKPVNDG